MKLVVNLGGGDGPPHPQGGRTSELLVVESERITTEVARDLAGYLKVHMGHIIADGPVLSDAGKTVTVTVWSDVTQTDMRARTMPVRQLVKEKLRQEGIELTR